MGLGQIERLNNAIGKLSEPREVKLALGALASDLARRRTVGSADSKFLFTAALKSLSRIRGAAFPDLQLACLNECAQFFYANQMSNEALRATDDLLKLSRSLESAKWRRLAETYAGIVRADLGDVPAALTHYSNALEMAKAIGDVHAETICSLNLGTGLNYAGLYREAISWLRRSISLSSKCPDGSHFRDKASANMAQSYLLLGEFQQGYEVISSLVIGGAEPTDSSSALSRTIREATFVQLAIELGKTQEAFSHANACARYAAQSGTARATFEANLALALCDVYGGDCERGLNALQAASTGCDDGSASQTDALRLLVRALEHMGKPAKAQEGMRALLSQTSMHRERCIEILLGHSSLSTDVSDLESRPIAVELAEAKLQAWNATDELYKAQVEMLERLAITAELKEDISGQHGLRVGRWAALLAGELGWSARDTEVLEMGARLHDIGKVGIPDRILLTSEELKSEQRHFMSLHTTIGAEILSKSRLPCLRIAEQIARHHHECWDGSGYPYRLSGQQIPIHARIVALADVFDALTHGRPYGEAWATDRAIAEIEARRGKQFDPGLTDLFIVLLKRVRAHSDIGIFMDGAAANSPFVKTRNRIRALLASEHHLQEVGAL